MTEESYKELNVDEVLEAVHNGEISVEQAFDFELQGKKRKTLMDALKEIVNTTKSDDQKLDFKLHLVTFNRNVKYGKSRFRLGEKVKVTEEEYNQLLNAGVIQAGD
ncbi:hypothetical protein ABE096_13970 [Robertmurraya massiliosenegalensis]|uniref:hypothetical protein n=1 Tax=Robertmurraya TaxID=2837507 RepID=UPI0039A6F851